MALKPTKKNLKIEKGSKPLIEEFYRQWLTPKGIEYDLIWVDVEDEYCLPSTKKLLWLNQRHSADFYIDYGCNKFRCKPFAIIDDKSSEGFELSNGEWFPGFYKLTLEMFKKKVNDPEPKDRKDYVNYTSYAFPSKGFASNNQYILYIAPLMAIQIPKDGLLKSMKKYPGIFNVIDDAWKLNPSDESEEKWVKNAIIELSNTKHVKMLLESNSIFKKLNLETGKYEDYNPLKIKPYDIKQEYDSAHRKSFYNGI